MSTVTIKGSARIQEFYRRNEKRRMEGLAQRLESDAPVEKGDQKVAPTGCGQAVQAVRQAGAQAVRPYPTSIPYVTAEYLDMVDDMADPTLPFSVRRRYDEILNPTKCP